MKNLDRLLFSIALLPFAATGMKSSPALAALPRDVWLDVDPAIGIHEREVDDGLAMIQAFHSPELNVRGISVVFGNSALGKGYPIGQDVARRLGPPGLKVHAGAASSDDFGKLTDAVKAMAEALRQKPMTILALGPVTNVGTLVKLYPHLNQRIETIVIVAARRPGQRFITGSASNPPHRDFNFELDPRAMAVVLETDIRLVFAPWEVSSQVWIRQADLYELEKRGEVGEWIARASASWLGRWKEGLGVDGFNPFDTLGVGWVTHPRLIESMEVGVWIEEGEDDRSPAGSGKRKPYLLVDPERQDVKRAVYCFKPKPGFKPLLMDRLAGDALDR